MSMRRFIACAALACTLEAVKLSSDLPQTYEAFLDAFNLTERRSTEGPLQRRRREAAFWRRHAAASEQNGRRGRWRAAASHLFDATGEEMASLFGYKPVAGKHQARGFLTIRTSNFSVPLGVVLPQAMDWRSKVRSSNVVRNQGSCGSCWAISTLNALEMYAEMAGVATPSLAVNELLTCTPNAQHCGGTGGCGGATSELAFQYVKEQGLGEGCGPQGEAPRLFVESFVHLESNQAFPLQYALATRGPVVVSVDANNWETYGGGIFDACAVDAQVNHAVLAVGFGTSTAGKYWTIRNSWGDRWGENGHMRLLREEKPRCGTDYHPQEGIACDGETKPVPVCGMCGILFDSSFPVGLTNSKPPQRQ